MRGTEAADRLHLAEKIVEDVAPVAQHVEDDAAPVLLPVIPRRPLRRLAIPLEYPVAELAAHRKQPAEKTFVAKLAQLEESRQPELVLDHAVLDARLLCGRVQRLGLGERRGHGLFAVHMLARGDSTLQEPGTQLRRSSVEENFVVILQGGVEVRRPALHAMLLRQSLDL